MSADEDRAPPTSESRASERDLLVTYRSLRLSLVLAMLMLAASVLYEAWMTGEIRGSISSYFYSPVRSIFVGALVVIGFSLVTIHAEEALDDLWLTIGGVSALVVALVPTGAPTCDSGTTGALGAGVTDAAMLECRLPGDDALPGWVVSGVENNALAFAIAAAIALVVAWCTTKLEHLKSPTIVAVVFRTYVSALVIAVVLFAKWEDFRANAHMGAAIITFGCVGAYAFAVGYRREGKERVNKGWPGRTYRTVPLAMFVAGVAYFFFKGYDDALFWVEVVEITLFAAFWLAQTIQHWGLEKPVEQDSTSVLQAE
jgi:hypothetical protein